MAMDDLSEAVGTAALAFVAAVRAQEAADLREDMQDELAGDESYLTSLFTERQSLIIDLIGVDSSIREGETPLMVRIEGFNSFQTLHTYDPIQYVVDMIVAGDYTGDEAIEQLDKAVAALQSGIDRLNAARQSVKPED